MNNECRRRIRQRTIFNGNEAQYHAIEEPIDEMVEHTALSTLGIRPTTPLNRIRTKKFELFDD